MQFYATIRRGNGGEMYVYMDGGPKSGFEYRMFGLSIGYRVSRSDGYRFFGTDNTDWLKGGELILWRYIAVC